MAKNNAEVHSTFERFLEVLKNDLEAVEKRIISANSSFSSDISQSQKTEPGDNVQPESQTQSSSTTDKPEEKLLQNKELTERRTEYGVAWVSYMRFARRAEGLKPSRAVFGKARKERWTPWEVYEAAGRRQSSCSLSISDNHAP